MGSTNRDPLNPRRSLLGLMAIGSLALAGGGLSPARAEVSGEITARNLAIVKSTYEGRNSQENAENLKRHVADDIEWTEAAGFPYAGTYRGFAEIEERVFKRLATEWVDYSFTVEGYLADGALVMAYGTYRGRYAGSGKAFEARVAHLWELEDGKIVRFEQFVDSHPVRAAMAEG